MTEQRQNAAALVAAGKLTIPQIAKKAGVSPRTVSLWKKDKEFQAEVRKAANAWRAKARGKGVADQDERLRELNDLKNRLRSAFQARAQSEEMKGVPGGETGMVCVKYRNLSHWEFYGEDRFWVTERVPEYVIDTETPAQICAILQQAAIEMGQWNPKAPAGGGDINVQITQVMIERLHAGRQRVAEEKERRDAATRLLLPGN